MDRDCNKPKPKAGQFSVEYCPAQGYFVLSPEGSRVSGPYGAKNKALMGRSEPSQGGWVI